MNNPTRPTCRLVFVTGKGGVGRSSVTAGIAVRAAEAGARVLAVDAVNDGGLHAALGARARSVDVLSLTTEAALDQYIELYLPLPISPSRIGPIARIFEYVANAAPGVREILALGKLAHEATEGPWDLVVVDSPATGHVVELLAAADNLGELIGLGPLVEQTRWISELMADPKRTSALVVAAPEELPVTEALELVERLGLETRLSAPSVVLNRMPPRPQPSAETRRLIAEGGALAVATELVLDLAAESATQQQRLITARLRLVEVPEARDPVRAIACSFPESGNPW